ncbi:uncharacterized protein LOC118826996 isoform X3 [Colossoma macropomum]|uniref:uncharacterized protein LOC118826996 isoform X3 n=1 Tax=Colossoma macropomum TaxID=42526 RepID=UPI0018649486|nr:uncharacterized protein LOC118826996 isoform X3 [Colossoma macropomum]
MQSCSSALCILILISTFTTLSESCFTSVKVKLHDSAVLPCYGRCSVWGRWTALGNPDDVLAECDQTSCRSVKEGNQMIHDQYLKGNLSLTISDAVFSQRTWYTCKCESHNICDVSVQTEHGDPGTDKGATVPVWVFALAVAVIVVLVVVIVWMKKCG